MSSTAPGNLATCRLTDTAVVVPALQSRLRPSLVLPESQARALLQAATEGDVSLGGQYSAGPAGVQLWSGPFDGPSGSRGSALHLGSVDWTYHTPAQHYATIYRSFVTAEGVAVGLTPELVLAAILGLASVHLDGNRLTQPLPPVRDPFRSGRPRSRPPAPRTAV